MNREIGLFLIAAALLGAGAGPAAARRTAQAVVEQVDVFTAGEDGYHTFRIPSVIRTPGGALLAFAEGRRGSASDTGDIDLVMKRSRDGGRSWSALLVVGDNGPHTFGNPCPVVDTRTGTIWLLSTHNPGTAREADIIAGTADGTRTVWIMRSEDDGRTWSEPREITGEAKRPTWTWYATGPGIGIQLRSGRLVVPANHAQAGTRVHRSHILYSDDRGTTWEIGAVSDPGTNESQAAELSDGRVMLNMRNHPPLDENFRRVATSADGGLTLSRAEPHLTLVEPPAQASLLAVPDSPRGHALLFANPAAATRVRMTVRLSTDGGNAWSDGLLVHDGPSAYASLVWLGDGLVGLLYERGDETPYERITLARIPFDSLRQ